MVRVYIVLGVGIHYGYVSIMRIAKALVITEITIRDRLFALSITMIEIPIQTNN